MASAYGGDVPSIKVEGAAGPNGPEPVIKSENDVANNPSFGQSDEDIYEDTGDLDFTGSDQSISLIRLPNFLWETWSKLDDDQEVQIGTLRVEGTQGDVKRVCH